MRTEIKLQKRQRRKKKFLLRLKKVCVFFIVFMFVIGLVAVDEAYSDIMGTTGELSLHARRLDQDKVSISLLGKETTLNMTEVEDKIVEVQNRGTDILEDVAKGIRSYLGFEEWPREDLPFTSKIL